ncbi:MAG: AAA family ATPase [Gammaproteobacteria bacterium]
MSASHESLDDMMGLLLQQAPWSQLEQADYAHIQQDVNPLAAALQGALRERRIGINVLLYGPPGTGKTELAKLLATMASANLYEVTSNDDDGAAANERERYLSYVLSQKFLSNRQNSLVLFDEAEDVLPQESPALGFGPISISAPGQTKGKAWVNHLLETNPTPTIWICNRIDSIDPAYLRRFTYHLELRNPPRPVRYRIAAKHLSGLNVSEKVLDQIAAYENLSPAQLEAAARMISLAQPADPGATEVLLLRALHNSMNALRQPKGGGNNITAISYDLRYLNLDTRFDIDKMIGALRIRSQGSLCLYGPPGTGKTQLVHHLAERLEKPLLTKKASDLFSKWLGESEQNIAAMFSQANEDGAILFLDEADGFLGDRNAASTQWAISLVNELLQQMEQFDGVFVCATNLFSKLDIAALRRFTFKVRFDYLTAEQRWSLFLQETGLTDNDTASGYRRQLDRLDTLTPGDFATVRRQELALAEPLSPEDFIAQLVRECEAKNQTERGKPIGFVW